MFEAISQPWPWWIAGPLLGLVVPMLLLFGGKMFGISSSLRHMCAATCPHVAEYFDYDWVRKGLWNLAFVVGLILGGFIASNWLEAGGEVAISEATWQDLSSLGIERQAGFAPTELFSWNGLGTLSGFLSLVAGGFLLGFGARWGGGCTSGHAISGLAARQLPSLIAVLGFFAGGLLVTYVLLPLIVGGGAHG